MPQAQIAAPEIPGSLACLEERVLEALDLVRVALECSMEAVEAQDRELARMVIGDDDYTDRGYAETNIGLISLLGGPLDEVALRTAVALLRVSRHVERIGDQCVNLAKLVTQGRPTPHRDTQLREGIGRMGRLAQAQLWQAKLALAERDEALARDIVRRDQEINQLNRECFQRAVEVGAAAELREWAMHMVLAARWLERIGDNGVDIGEAAAFIATGTLRELAGSY